MAGLTKQELAGKSAYTASSDPPPAKEWKDLTAEEKAEWIEKAASSPPPVEAKAPARPMPLTDPEHGDLTPEWAAWYLETEGREAFNVKYAGRLDLLPAELLAQ